MILTVLSTGLTDGGWGLWLPVSLTDSDMSLLYRAFKGFFPHFTFGVDETDDCSMYYGTFNLQNVHRLFWTWLCLVMYV